MGEQFLFFWQDILRIIGRKKYRFFLLLFTRSFWGLFLYRFERTGFLIFGQFYGVIRLPFIPFFAIMQSFSNIDIHYKASIKGGVLILHPSVGVVISGKSIIGKQLTLTGGNVIGISSTSKSEIFEIGDFCNLGANATIIGPLVLGNHITIGASSCVVKSFEQDNLILAGVPAKKIIKANGK